MINETKAIHRMLSHPVLSTLCTSKRQQLMKTALLTLGNTGEFIYQCKEYTFHVVCGDDEILFGYRPQSQSYHHWCVVGSNEWNTKKMW